jgi:hypothetical protein
MRTALLITALFVLSCSHSPASVRVPTDLRTSTDASFAEPLFGIAFSQSSSWLRTIQCTASLDDCTIFLDPPSDGTEPSSANPSPRQIAVSWYPSATPPTHERPCAGVIDGSPLGGAIYDVEQRMYGDNGYAGIGEGAEACLTDGHARRALITMAPPSNRTNRDLLRVVSSFRFISISHR